MGTSSDADLFSRLARYYLACLAADDDSGVSLSATGAAATRDYIALPTTSLADVLAEGASPPTAAEFAAQRQRARSRPTLLIGYPTFIGPSTRGAGLCVEPLLLFEADSNGASDHYPSLNPAFLRRYAMDDEGGHIADMVALAEEIGISDASGPPPSLANVVHHLVKSRPDWPWAEPSNPDALITAPFARGASSGIYNRAILCAIEPSQYTRGLEYELDALSKQSPQDYATSALDAWTRNGLPSSVRSAGATMDLLEPLPLNDEQRQAVRLALADPLTVITGPPGSGKSQVVTALLMNAILNGQRVLFASKNHKAVDVVEERLNGLADSPVLLRIGNNEHAYRLAERLDALRAAQPPPDAHGAYERNRLRQEELAASMAERTPLLERVVRLRNKVDRLEREVEPLRESLSSETFAAIGLLAGAEIVALRDTASALRTALAQTRQDAAPLLTRLLWPLFRASRQNALADAAAALADTLCRCGLSPHPTQQPLHYLSLAAEVEAVHSYFATLRELQEATPPECVAAETLDLRRRFARNSLALWQSQLAIQPDSLTSDDRRALGEFSASLRLLAGADSQQERPTRADFNRHDELFQRVGAFLPAWAVTSLSARRLPLAPAAYDLLVIDEASQCDIASALPLLFRAKRAVIIGDPQQLRHISRTPESKDLRALREHGLADQLLWSYSAQSLYDLASSLAPSGAVVQLRDHHRSHPHIITFSNRRFYDGALRIATTMDHLTPAWDAPPFVRWVDIAGRANRPHDSGLVNEAEARAVVQQLRALRGSGYAGSIGIVAPFRAQTNLIRRLLNDDSDLNRWAGERDCMAETVHRYQGDERDTIIFSPTVAPGATEGALRFLRINGHLFNVAITRARASLLVVGNRSYAKASGVVYLAEFADYVTELDGGASPADASPCDGYPRVRNPEQVSPWECILYRALVAAGLHPIPQYTVDQYDLDFALFTNENGRERRLAIEVDGQRYHQDWDGDLLRRDQLRNERLIALGWDVLRFWVYELRDDLPQCLARIHAWASPSP